MAKQFKEAAAIAPVQQGDKITSRGLKVRLPRGRISQWTRREFFGAAALPFFPQTAKSARPNVVILYVDQLRATALKLYDPDGVETPNLSRLAGRGVLFTNGFTPHPLCMPARVSLWTGQYSHTHGSRSNQMPLRDDRESMAASFQAGGYRLGLFGKNHCFTPAQLQRWFAADYSLGSSLWNAALTPALVAQIRKQRQWARECGGMPAASPFPSHIFEPHLITQRAIEFIDRQEGQPFVAWVSIPDPHTRIQPPEEFARMVTPDQVKLPPLRHGEMKTKNMRMQIFDYLIRGSDLPESFLRHFLSLYYGIAAFIDYDVGRILAALERKKLVENTIVVFTSDHGDFAAEHHLFGKTGSLLDSLVRVPFLVSWPRHIPEGRREDALVNQIDIMPTLLEWCGLPVPRGVEGQRLPFGAKDAWRSFVYSEYGNGDPQYTWEQARAVGPAKKLGTYRHDTELEQEALAQRERAGQLRMVRTARHKLISDSNGETEFYDLVKDPHELQNVHGRPEYRAAEQELDRKL